MYSIKKRKFKMYYLTSLKTGQDLEVVLSDLEHALVILDEVSDKFFRDFWGEDIYNSDSPPKCPDFS
jgi:hypothetical protein